MFLPPTREASSPHPVLTGLVVGVTQAKAVCAVTDGADWIQGFIDLHRPAALRILDFPHAAEHLNHFLHLKGHTREEKQCYDPLIIGDATETCTRHGHSRL